MSGLTKEELKNALVNHGVPLPPASAKKEELVSLYETHIAPVDRDAGDFSSDDEVTISPRKKASQSSVKSRASSKSPKKVSKSKVAAVVEEEESSLLVGDLDIDALDDDQLFTLLQENGINPGPIVGSTRPFYKKKLALVLKGGGDSSIVNGSNGNTEFSDTEPDTEEEEEQPSAVSSPAPADTVPVKRVSSRSKASSSSSSLVITGPAAKSPADLAGGLRRRLPLGDELDSSSVARTTPTPRRSIHSYKVTETTVETTVRTRDGVETVDSSRTVERTESKTEEEAGSGKAGWCCLKRLLLLLLLVALAGGLAYYLLQQKGAADFSPEKILADIKGALPLAGPEATEAPLAAEEAAPAPPAEAPAATPPPAPVEPVEIVVEQVEEPVRVVPPAEESLPEQAAVADV